MPILRLSILFLLAWKCPFQFFVSFQSFFSVHVCFSCRNGKNARFCVPTRSTSTPISFPDCNRFSDDIGQMWQITNVCTSSKMHRKKHFSIATFATTRSFRDFVRKCRFPRSMTYKSKQSEECITVQLPSKTILALLKAHRFLMRALQTWERHCLNLRGFNEHCVTIVFHAFK